jgi:hypothetical protein
VDDGQPERALALWRAGREGKDALPLVGMPLLLTRSIPNQGHAVSVQGTKHSQAFEPVSTQGHDPAVIQPWLTERHSGYLVAYDSQEGAELAFVPAQVSSDFDEASRLPIPSPGARQVALAVVESEGSLEPGSEIALAWRAPTPAGSALILARVSFDPAAEPAFVLLSCGSFYESSDLIEEPSLVYDPRGFAVPSLARGGGFFLTWIEQAGGNRRLLGARVPATSTAPDATCTARLESDLMELPFSLSDSTSIEHAFTFSDPENPLRYVFITGQRLNIGSLRCQ